MRAPTAGQPLTFPLLDPVRGDLMEHKRAEGLVERFEDLAVPIGTLLVQISVVLQVGLSELPKRDIRLSADTSAPVQDLLSFRRLNVSREVLVGCLCASAVSTAVDLKVVVPMMGTARRRCAVQWARFATA